MPKRKPKINNESSNNHSPNGKINGKRFQFKFRVNFRTILLILLIFFFIGPFLFSLTNSKSGETIPLSTAISDTKAGKVDKIKISGDKLVLTYKAGEQKVAIKESSESFTDILKNSNIDPTSISFSIEDQLLSRIWVDVLGILLPLGLMGLFFLFIFRQARGAQDNLFSFGKSGARIFAKGKQNVTFKDVAGVDEAKKELEEVVDFLKNPGKYRALGARTPKGALIVGPAGTGKCVTGDAIIWTNKGLMEIKDVPRYYFVDPRTQKVYGAGLASLDLDKVYSEKRFASHWFDLGEQETTKIRLSSGFSLEGTPEHPVLVMGTDGRLRFRKLENLEKGDYVAIQYGRKMFGNLQLLDEDTSYLMGLLTGDGNLSISSRVGLTSIDPEIIEFFRNYVRKHYSTSAITVRGQSYLVASWDFKKYLYQMGMSYLLSFDKVVPPTILQSPQEIQTAFLQGLFDTDASVEKNRAAIEYTTVSERMARQVQMMLLNLGVVANLNVKGKPEHGYHRSVYRIGITGAALVSFAKTVSFRLSRKREQLEKHVKRMVRLNTNVDIIPGISHIVEESWREISRRKLSNEKLSKIIDKVRRRARVSRQVLTEYIAYASSLRGIKVPHLEYLRSIFEANLFFSPVVEKTYGWSSVYDFTVPGTHSFLGNGFVNHNTLLARAVAGEAGAPFFSMAGSEFMEMLVGVGASRTRDLFATAKKAAPAIIFIDEIDAIGRQRGFGIAGGHDEREQTLNQILVEMDGFTPNDNVVVIAATNRPDILDPALIRPGRFDRRVVLDMPDKEGRLAILKIHARGKKFVEEVNWERVASRTVGFSGADLENMLNEAAILAAREDKKGILTEDIEEAATKVKLGPAKRRLQSEEDKRITAYHESGHALVTHSLPQMDPVHRISIVARGMSLGHTLIPPAMDRSHETRTRLLQQITAMLGGRAAEQLVFGEMTTGASNDISNATNVARRMVMDFGMSKLGPINWGPQYDSDELGRTRFIEPVQISPKMQEQVDQEVRNIVEACYAEAAKILKRGKRTLDAVADVLVKKETLDREDFEEIVGEKPTIARPTFSILRI